jgi:hypothetical protein
MHERKNNHLTRVSLAIFVLLVMVISPFGYSMTMEVSLDSQTNESINSTFSEDAFNEMASESIAPKMDSNYFTENMGQWEDHIKFLAKTSFGHVALGDNCVYYYLVLRGEGHSIKITFQNSQSAAPVGLGKLGFESNYFLGNDETKWMTKVKSFDRVMYEDAWLGNMPLFRIYVSKWMGQKI